MSVPSKFRGRRCFSGSSWQVFKSDFASSKSKGFSLIEVVIAMSVVAVAVLSIVGLVSTALLNFGSSLQKSTSTLIHDQVVHDLQQAVWEEQGNVYSIPAQPTTYYDAQANKLPDPTGAIYQVTITIGTNPVNVPVASGGTPSFFVDSSNNNSLTVVQTSIYRYPGPVTTPLNWYTDYVARN